MEDFSPFWVDFGYIIPLGPIASMEGKEESNKRRAVKLNIGGRKFITSSETLTRVPGSFFSVLIV